MQTVGRVNGWVFNNGSAGKRWIRGRKMVSVGKKWISQNEYEKVLVITNLDTGEMVEADSKTYKKFLTPESYNEWLLKRFAKM